MPVYKHEAVLTFVGRLVHDHEFCEWFATNPMDALGSHGLTTNELKDLAAILRDDRRQTDYSAALRPMIDILVETTEDTSRGDAATRSRYHRLVAELNATHEQVAAARSRRAHPWWKFWS